jgi:ABC-2 type transport system permease protein
MPRFKFRIPRLTLLNPIIIKEMRGQMRGSRAFWILTGYLLGLGALVYFLYRIVISSVNGRFGPGGLPQSAYIGQILFISLAFLELIFIALLTPALTAGTISGEVERRTFDMLMATPLRPASVLWGKLVASLGYIQLLILAAIPLFSIVFLFGGMVLRDAIQAVGLMVLVAITYGTMGLFFSALTRRTGRAVALTYLVAFIFIFGTAFAYITAIALQGGGTPPQALLYLNPISAMQSAIMTPETMDSVYGMGSIITIFFMALSGGRDIMGYSSPIAAARPLWQYTTALYLALTLVFYLLTTQLVKPVRRWRVGRMGLIGGVLALLLTVGGLALVFGTARGSTGLGASGVPTPAPFPVPAVVSGVVREVAVVEVPAPTPTPAATPPPFDLDQGLPLAQAHLEQNLLAGAGNVFCDLAAVHSGSDEGGRPQLAGWAHCRAFTVAEDALVPGVGITAPAVVHFYLTNEGWVVSHHELSDSLQNIKGLDPAAQDSLAEMSFDEAAAEKRLVQRAHQALLGE